MVISTFILLLIGQRSTLQERILTRGLMRDTVGVDQMGGLRHLSRMVIGAVFLLYFAGAAVIFTQLQGLEGISFLRSLWHSLFLSAVSYTHLTLPTTPYV